MLGRPSEEESLDLVRAYFSIREPDRRQHVLDLAKTYASEASSIEILAHHQTPDENIIELSERRSDQKDRRCAPSDAVIGPATTRFRNIPLNRT